MSMYCDHASNRDGTCNLAWGGEDEQGNIIEWDTENYCVDEKGYCGTMDAEFPGDLCEAYQPDLAGEYCERCGEYLGYGEEDENEEEDYEESECRCNG